MNPLDIAIFAAGAFALYKITTPNSPASLNGEYDLDIVPKKIANKNSYNLDSSLFGYLEPNLQTILLQNYSHDYTSPRMIADEKLYQSAVSAANLSGAPCGWIQIVAIRKPTANLQLAADKMLRFCDEFISKNNKNQIDLEKLRNDAISVGLRC